MAELLAIEVRTYTVLLDELTHCWPITNPLFDPSEVVGSLVVIKGLGNVVTDRDWETVGQLI